MHLQVNMTEIIFQTASLYALVKSEISMKEASPTNSKSTAGAFHSSAALIKFSLDGIKTMSFTGTGWLLMLNQWLLQTKDGTKTARRSGKCETTLCSSALRSMISLLIQRLRVQRKGPRVGERQEHLRPHKLPPKLIQVQVKNI